MSRASIQAALSERTYLTFGGNETYLLFIQAYPLREFCAFEVIDDERAWQRMEDELLRPIADAAAVRGMGLLADCFVWRASSDYIARLGAASVAAVNERAVRRMRGFIDRWRSSGEAARGCPVIVSGDLGPRGDGYAAGVASVEAAYDYHAPQVDALARADIDLLVPLTMTSLPEALGILRAAERAALPALVSPTIETDGTLPDGTALGEFVAGVDEATSGYATSFMVNCAHPSHLEPTLRAAAERGEAWLERMRGLRANASAKTHAELDNSTELDRGDPVALAEGLAELQRVYGWSILGGCCGTDAEHLARIAFAC
ncbi:MAG TPA: homocysteine S-methyltransferase family protein, partial [Polyangiaceae bacterium]|nr:homocysteine S-methyltransferase family protein [Polyangiaceae bacterium]